MSELVPMQEWADQPLPLSEAMRHLEARALTRCEKAVYWSLTDVAAARVVIAAIDPAHLEAV